MDESADEPPGAEDDVKLDSGERGSHRYQGSLGDMLSLAPSSTVGSAGAAGSGSAGAAGSGSAGAAGSGSAGAGAAFIPHDPIPGYSKRQACGYR